MPRIAANTEALLESLYDELRRLAHARMNRLAPGQTLQPTELVHEAWLRLSRDSRDDATPRWNSRGHFFGAAARAMRDILVDHARRKAAHKRGGDRVRVDITITLVDGDQPMCAEELLTLHNALQRLQHTRPKHAELVLLNHFAGLSLPHIAELRGVSLSTIEREWRVARARLRAYMVDRSTDQTMPS